MKKIPLQLKSILRTPQNAYELFQQQTEITALGKQKVAPHKVYFKAYDRLKAIKLGRSPLSPTLKKILKDRSSQRECNIDNRITPKQIGSLLYYSSGLHTYKSQMESYRFYPSAGGRFPLELYLIPNRIDQLSRGGVYHYNVRGDYVEERVQVNPMELKACFQQQFVSKSDAIIVISGVFKRTTMKYGERGYRYVLMESGHIGQNIYLVGQSLGLNVCGICGFFDEKVNRYLHIDGVSESALYCFALNAKR